MFKPLFAVGLAAAALVTLSAGLDAQTAPAPAGTEESKPAAAPTPAPGTAASPSKLDALTKGMKKVEGMWTMYHSDQKLLVHLKPADLGKDYMFLTSIARGISSGRVLGGMTWGDDVIWQLRKVGERIHVVRRNVRFKASKAGSPEAEAVKLAYSDSVLYALPILVSEQGADLVDMTPIFMSDDEQIGRFIGSGFRFAADRSTWAKVKAFAKNVELQVAAVYAGTSGPETISDPRGVQVNVHYSISLLPSNNYKPRAADDRVGYFLTVVKDFSSEEDDKHFVRYITRWDLQKADPQAKLSPPKEPIIFYLEKTVPIRLRPTVQAGIEEWNRAFEKIGFANAIQVRQQRDDDSWDPEDVNYNTFRWITAEAGFAMGPSRVNPTTGQILDADIIFDASFLRYWKDDYETFTPADAKALFGRPEVPAEEAHPFGQVHQHGVLGECHYCRGMQQQFGFAAAALMGYGLTTAEGRLPEEFVHQALKEVVMHEVGHTLGLRHNFKASSWRSLEEINALPVDAGEATVASVMDYSPANIAPKGSPQGPYYSPTIGPYDYWAIEYGYKPIEGKESDELNKIASRGAEPGHDYATDEDTTSASSDPLSNRFDLGKDPVEFARRQMALAVGLMPGIVERAVKEGEGYQRARQAFGLLFSEYWRTAAFAARFPGGVLVNRDHKGDPNGRPPLQIVPAEQQRAAMKLLAETALASPRYDGQMLNYLAPSRWSHWGMRAAGRPDYPIHDFVEMMQLMILSELTSRNTLSRLHEGELKVPADADAYTLAEHLRLLVECVFSEMRQATPGEFSDRNPYISSFRRNLQRNTLKQLAALVTSGFGVPEDARTLSRMHLAELDRHITQLLANPQVKLDDYSRAHLEDLQTRIRQVLEAKLSLGSVN